MTHQGAGPVGDSGWSRRLFIKETGAGIGAGAVGCAFSKWAAAAEGGAGDFKGVQQEPSAPEGLLQARELLRQKQAEHPTPRGLAQFLSGESVLASTLAYLNQRRNFEPVNVAGRVRRGGMLFERDVEERRIALAEDLVHRTDPGPFEDPNYLALLAYQAASLEPALSDSVDGRKIDRGWSRFLLGTIHYRELNAYSRTLLSPENYTIVALYSGLVEFAYQAAKSVIAALHPVRSTVPGRSVTADVSDQHIADELSRNREPIERLYRTLEAYFFTTGYPRAFRDESVPPEQGIPLALLIDMAERWIIAHEYGHGFAARIGFAVKAAPVAQSREQAEEYFADDIGMVLTVLSAKRLDHVGPVFSLAGPTFALTCLEVLRRSNSVVRHGTVLPDSGDKDHPPNEIRIKNILNAFDFYFDVLQDDQAGIKLELAHRARDWAPVDSEAGRVRRAGAMRWSRVLLTIWSHVRPLLQKDHDNKRPLHRIWT